MSEYKESLDKLEEELQYPIEELESFFKGILISDSFEIDDE